MNTRLINSHLLCLAICFFSKERCLDDAVIKVNKYNFREYNYCIYRGICIIKHLKESFTVNEYEILFVFVFNIWQKLKELLGIYENNS